MYLVCKLYFNFWIEKTPESIEQKPYKGRNPVKIQKNIKKVTPQNMGLKEKEKLRKFPNTVIHRMML